ncbi:hypothetical protein NRB15_00395 [Pseudomonas alliivorans]|uniref:hypothetical protein n=1 Tax=Pseudomonas alliivorans TaxID=2810613 RepID=UPI00211C8BA9|nr:hypothetical protein [Pseudomonas alliivorans]MCQ9468789.1 hypothetical protein [Pseudomonas alliivorans]
MNGEIPLSSFATALMTVGDLDEGTSYPKKLVSDLMNGHATDFVYNTLSLSDRRTHGVFFSGASWAKKILEGHDLTGWQRFIDPSVGVGDLLLEVCRSLPLKKTANETIGDWANRLVAVDLRKSFLDIAWMRIQALAFHRHAAEKGQSDKIHFRELPQNFLVGDALETNLHLTPNDCVVMNPPYQRIQAPENSFTGKGKRSAAAVHLERIVRIAPPGVGIFALIPDVLRSGSSYAKFRAELTNLINFNSFEPFGAFGTQADIDVAILVAISKAPEELLIAPEPEIFNEQCVEDFFSVSVGPVVPHRTLTDGKLYGYLTAKNAVVGQEIKAASEFATYNCRIERGPFVIVRRTSSPSDRKRARSTLFSSREEALVENHLLILKPKDKKISTCRLLLNVLDDERTDAWLNHRIRCRHLTVGAIKSLPWIVD